MAENISQFALRIKSKYPEYKNLDDTELVRKVINKYPEYETKILPEDLTRLKGTDNIQKQTGISESEVGNTNLKPIYKQLSDKEYPVLAPVQEAIGQASSAFLNQAALGLPEATLKKTGYMLPKPETLTGKIAEGIGAGAGVVAGLPTKVGVGAVRLASKVMPKILGKGLGKTVARSAIQGTAIGLAETPETGILEPTARLKQGATGGVLGGLLGFAGEKAIDIAKNIKNIKFPERLAQKARNSLFQSKEKAGKEFQMAIDKLSESNPDLALSAPPISLREAVDNLRKEIELTPKLRTDINTAFKRAKKLAPMAQGKEKQGSNALEYLLDNPEAADNVSLKEAQDIIQIIKKVPSLQTKLKAGKFANWSENDFPLLDFIDDVKLAQSEAYPQLQAVKDKYREFKQGYDLVKNKFKEGKLIENMQKNWGDKEVQNKIKQILPPETIQEIGGYRNALKLLKYAAYGSGVAALAGGDYAIRASFQKSLGEITPK